MKLKITILTFLFLSVSFFSFCNEKISLNFKDADVKIVLQTLAEKSGVNIVPSPEVAGLVTVQLKDVDWQTALEVILRTYNYDYVKYKDIIIVAPLEKIKEREAHERERQEVEPPRIRIFKLKYIDAADAKKAIQPILSPSGKVSVLEITGQAGWEFGADVTKRIRATEGKLSRTKTLIVSDISKKLDEIEELLKKIDVMPQQILIRARIMEINRDLLNDIGFDWGTGTTGAETSTITLIPSSKSSGTADTSAGGHLLTPEPSLFDPKTTGLSASSAGLRLMFKKLTGSQFEVILHALEEDARTNTLSSPTILTLNNQEASILVGTKFPIVEIEISEETGNIIGGSLAYYQDIGIQLNVVPQISGEDEEFINMIVHPAVTSFTETKGVKEVSGGTETTLVEYPVIISREAETQVMVRDGETIVMGGLYKDILSKHEIGIPFLSKIPILGFFFRRYTEDLEKIDLLIFITAKIVKPGELIPLEILDTQSLTSEFEKKLLPLE